MLLNLKSERELEAMNTIELVNEAIEAGTLYEHWAKEDVSSGGNDDEAKIMATAYENYIPKLKAAAEKKNTYIRQLTETAARITKYETLEDGVLKPNGKGGFTYIKDSGERTSFNSGAVRDMHEGKGRFDLMPLAETLNALDIDSPVIDCIIGYLDTGKTMHLEAAVQYFVGDLQSDKYNAMLDLAKHYENGAKKYGENNWQKGIPTSSYIDSAIRHYCKHMAGQTDERHDVAFIWNLISAIWTCEHKPEYNSYAKGESEE